MRRLTQTGWLENWDPEDAEGWEAGGKKIARRNLIGSVIAEHVGFSVWSIWSVMVLFMPEDVYGIDPGGKFILAAVPILLGSALRIPYSIGPARFGGRNFMVGASLLLFIPAGLTTYFITHPTTYTMYLVVAATGGVGGGVFAAAMSHTNMVYPQRLKGLALGLNAGGGNIGVPVVQIVGLLVIATAGNGRPEIVCAIYLVLIAVAALCAALLMNNIPGQHASLNKLVEALKYREAWLMSLLYVGSFGSFIGFSFAFGQVLQLNYKAAGESAAQATLHAAQIAWIGPLLGAGIRPIGGKLADRIGGAKVTFMTFVAMTVVGAVLAITGSIDDSSVSASTGAEMATYICGFFALFLLAGLGNGSTYKLIPTVFEAKSHGLSAMNQRERALWSRAISGALLGFTGAVGALGGVFINMTLKQSYSGAAKSGTTAFFVFLGFYIVCALVTWWFFVRRVDMHRAGVIHRIPEGRKTVAIGIN